MLASGLARQWLGIVEADPEWRRICGNVAAATSLPVPMPRALEYLFEARRIDRIANVVSILPILHFGRKAQRAVLDDCFTRAVAGTSLMPITDLPGSPVRQYQLRTWSYGATRHDRIMNSGPAATLWQYRPFGA
ncbi:hypothetical protein V5738_03580 [Salinisphaera sp. SPP-AMP-43]|uniref:hypothetical protein n=1 Tax=Salinisphaera sp. SPP-AMP-43 TaxID=3121288 RepID=UPI003C6E0BC4